MKHYLFIFIFTLISCLSSSIATAQTPVFDAAGSARLLQQIDAMAKDYQKQLDQLDELNKQRLAITGTRNAGDLVNGALEQKLRQYLPHTWEDTLHMMDAGTLPSGSDATADIYTGLLQTYDPVQGPKVFASDPNGALSKAMDRRTQTAYAAMAASEQAYNNLAGRIQIYETLLGELNNTQDLKASIDLQARISAENGLILSELMRLNAIQIQQRGALENQELSRQKRAATANRYDPQKAGQAMLLNNEN